MDPADRGPVPVLYDNIQTVAVISLNRLARLWEEELRTTISDANWQAAITLVHSSSICIRHGLLQFKVLHRLHLSASKLAKLYLGLDPIRIRCRRELASATCFGYARNWLFWTGIFGAFSCMCNEAISPNPLTALFRVVAWGPGRGYSTLHPTGSTSDTH